AASNPAPPAVAFFAHLDGEWMRAALGDLDAVPLDLPRRQAADRLREFEAATGLSITDVLLPNVESAEAIRPSEAGAPWHLELYTTDERRFERAVWDPLVRAVGRRRSGGIVQFSVPGWPTFHAFREGRRVRILVGGDGAPPASREFAPPTPPGAAARRPADPEASWVWWGRGVLSGKGPWAGREGRALLDHEGRAYSASFELRAEGTEGVLAAARPANLKSRLEAIETTAVFFAGRGVAGAAVEGLGRIDTAKIAGLFALDLGRLVAGWVGDEVSVQIVENTRPGREGTFPGAALTVETSSPRLARAALTAMERELGNWDMRFESEEYRGIELRSGALKLLPRCRPTWAILGDSVVVGYHPDFARLLVDKSVNSRVHPLLADLPDADWLGFIDYAVVDRINERLNASLAESDLPLEASRLKDVVFWAKEDGPRVSGRLVVDLR
ncbi:MAG: hypothetical protein KC466_20680, partial [Myxococcales bacterium]|nr:hypothetical protein [Myxococcales bacterium]